MTTKSLRAAAVAVAVAAAFAMAGCRSHAKVATAPVVAPTTRVATTPVTRVEPPAKDFVTPPPADDLGSDPLHATQIADQKGWLRDAFFAFDSSVLTPNAEDNLSDSATWLRDHSNR